MRRHAAAVSLVIAYISDCCSPRLPCGFGLHLAANAKHRSGLCMLSTVLNACVFLAHMDNALLSCCLLPRKHLAPPPCCRMFAPLAAPPRRLSTASPVVLLVLRISWTAAGGVADACFWWCAGRAAAAWHGQRVAADISMDKLSRQRERTAMADADIRMLALSEAVW